MACPYLEEYTDNDHYCGYASHRLTSSGFVNNTCMTDSYYDCTSYNQGENIEERQERHHEYHDEDSSDDED